MRHIIVAVIETTFASIGWAAEPIESKKFENIGLGSGAAIGAAAGGPVGLLLDAKFLRAKEGGPEPWRPAS